MVLLYYTVEQLYNTKVSILFYWLFIGYNTILMTYYLPGLYKGKLKQAQNIQISYIVHLQFD